MMTRTKPVPKITTDGLAIGQCIGLQTDGPTDRPIAKCSRHQKLSTSSLLWLFCLAFGIGAERVFKLRQDSHILFGGAQCRARYLRGRSAKTEWKVKLQSSRFRSSDSDSCWHLYVSYLLFASVNGTIARLATSIGCLLTTTCHSLAQYSHSITTKTIYEVSGFCVH